MYWINRIDPDELIETDADGRVVRAWPFREPADLVRSVRDWIANPQEDHPYYWNGEWFELMRAEGCDELEIEQTRDLMTSQLDWYYPCDTPEEIITYMRDHCED